MSIARWSVAVLLLGAVMGFVGPARAGASHKGDKVKPDFVDELVKRLAASTETDKKVVVFTWVSGSSILAADLKHRLDCALRDDPRFQFPHGAWEWVEEDGQRIEKEVLVPTPQVVVEIKEKSPGVLATRAGTPGTGKGDYSIKASLWEVSHEEGANVALMVLDRLAPLIKPEKKLEVFVGWRGDGASAKALANRLRTAVWSDSRLCYPDGMWNVADLDPETVKKAAIDPHPDVVVYVEERLPGRLSIFATSAGSSQRLWEITYP